MLFPVEENHIHFAEKYGLRIKKANCPSCNVEIETTIPFFIKGYVGLKSEDHGCGEKYTRKIMVAYSKEEKEFWAVIAKTM